MRHALLAAVLLAPALPAAASGTQGATAFDFLSIDVAPRAAALGGAYSAVADGADGVFYNPAGLAVLNKNEASFAHADHFQGISQDHLAVALRGGDGERLNGDSWLREGQGIGLYADTLDFGSVGRTTVSNQTGAGLDSFGLRDLAVGAGYARRLPWSWLAAGAAVKYLRESVDSTVAQTAAADLGVRADLDKAAGLPLCLGVAVQNLGRDPKWNSERSPLPTTLRLGAAWSPWRPLVAAVDLVQARQGAFSTHVGLEWRALEAAALRVGWNGQQDAGPGITAGIGVTWLRVSFDYAFVPYGDLGDSHRLGATYRW